MTKKRSRPGIFQTVTVMFFLTVGVTAAIAAEYILPDGYKADIIACSWMSTVMGLLSLWGIFRLKADTMKENLRLRMPRFGQAVIALICIPVILFVSDDLLLLSAAVLQKLGLNTITYINRPLSVQIGVRDILIYFTACSVLPSLTGGFLMFGILLSAWERRGTRYAVMAVAAFCAACCGNIVYILPVFLAAFGIGCTIISTGSLFLGMIMIFAQMSAGIAVRLYHTGLTRNTGRYADLFRTLGGGAGSVLLLFETMLLIGLYLSLIAVISNVGKRSQRNVYRRKLGKREMNYSTVFILSCALITCLLCMVFTTVRMTGGM